MRAFDWFVVVAYIGWIVIDGLRRSRNTDKVDGYFLASRSLPWWAVGLSVMATQMSAVTICCTTGQGYLSGLRFVQFYFGLPLAMVVLSITLVPFFYNSGVYTAYEYLEGRFDAKTRALTSFLFLLSRGRNEEALTAYREGIAVAHARGDKQAEKEMTVFARRIERTRLRGATWDELASRSSLCESPAS